MRLATWAFRKRWLVLVIWIVALVGANVIAGAKGPKYANAFSLPGTESQRAFDVLKERFPARKGDTGEIVFKADTGVMDPQVKATMEDTFDEVNTVRHVVDVESPYPNGQPPEGPPRISNNGKIAYATVQFDDQGGNVPVSDIRRVSRIVSRANGDGLQVEFGGAVAQFGEQEKPGPAEAIGVMAAIVILLVAFGSVLAMGLPIITALFGIGTGLALLTLLTYTFSTPNFAPQIASMIGLGVGIDYALFIVTRYKQGLSEGLEPTDANRIAMATAGRAVLFAGLTVVISMLGILLMGFKFVQGVAIGAAVVVAVVMLASLTLLAAMLGFTGSKVNTSHVPFLKRPDKPLEQTFWYRWSRVMQRHPIAAALVSLVLLLVMALPLFSMRLGVSDAGNNPDAFSSRQAYDLLAEGFGPGFNGPLLAVAELGNKADAAKLDGMVAKLKTLPDVASVSTVTTNSAGTAALVTIVPKSSPQDAETGSLLHTIRRDVIPSTAGAQRVPVHVGGLTAVFDDFSQQISNRLPILIAVVIGLSFLLLMVVFRSLLVPLKAAIMNLLSVGAAYGVIVAIFQWGWGGDIIGIGRKGPIEAWVPMMMFAILFGLSMDYEVFLLSRVREEYLDHGDNREAVANGLARTARVISAAAAIMICVFLAFVLGSDIRALKLFAIGLAVAVFVDVTIVRMALVPATMELLGDANWWLPRWLDRIIPHLSIEGHEAEEEALVAATHPSVGSDEDREPADVGSD